MPGAHALPGERRGSGARRRRHDHHPARCASGSPPDHGSGRRPCARSPPPRSPRGGSGSDGPAASSIIASGVSPGSSMNSHRCRPGPLSTQVVGRARDRRSWMLISGMWQPAPTFSDRTHQPGLVELIVEEAAADRLAHRAPGAVAADQVAGAEGGGAVRRRHLRGHAIGVLEPGHRAAGRAAVRRYGRAANRSRNTASRLGWWNM